MKSRSNQNVLSSSASPKRPAGGLKLWSFRLLAVVGTAAVFLCAFEAVLRVSGFGYPTSFLLSSENNGQKTFVQNPRFGWRFFGPSMARAPSPCSILQTKPSNTVRIFVFGESAAYGDPQPRFGLPRMIEAMLSLRHPGTRFEVINAAMTGINSHTILPIARDCTKAGADIWVIYMGNNEVVGPFGAGTVFGPGTPPMAVVRANLAIKATRIGQFLDSIRQRLQKPPPELSEWGGMTMFLKNEVAADDPRMKIVYRHFERNLQDIIHSAEQSGVGVVLSTVAVNLRDCGPFASTHRKDLAESDKARFDEAYRQGVAAQDTGDLRAASEHFSAAAQIDDVVAELHYRQGTCALARGDGPEAQRQFRMARDLDTLRFRCDSRLNDLTRRVASQRGRERVLLADAETMFSQQSANGLPGSDLFYEHVHLTFEGNYLLARTIAEQAEKLLPASASGSTGKPEPWPSPQACAERLAWTDWSRWSAFSDVLGRSSDPPFTWQMTHETQIQNLAAGMARLGSLGQPPGASEALRITTRAATTNPEDAWLQAQLALLEQALGDLPAAENAARRFLKLIPSASEGWAQLGFVLAQEKHYEQAVTAFQSALELDPQNVWHMQNIAQSWAKLGRTEDAISEYRRALAIKPRFGLAWLGLGQALEAAGHKTDAEECYHKALENRVHRAADLASLARFCQSRGWTEAAVTNFTEALKLSPYDGPLHLEAGQALIALGRGAEAAQHHAIAARVAPGLAQARFLHGLDLGREGKASAAAEEFRAAIQIMPGLMEARLNLGTALMKQGQDAEALSQFEEVLRHNPTNSLALRNAQALRSRITPH